MDRIHLDLHLFRIEHFSRCISKSQFLRPFWRLTTQTATILNTSILGAWRQQHRTSRCKSANENHYSLHHSIANAQPFEKLDVENNGQGHEYNNRRDGYSMVDINSCKRHSLHFYSRQNTSARAKIRHRSIETKKAINSAPGYRQNLADFPRNEVISKIVKSFTVMI